MDEVQVADSLMPMLLITLPSRQGTLELEPSEQHEQSFK